jgi:uncharacterized protein
MIKKYHIKGMHCVSCEVLLHDNLKEIKNIKDAKVSHKTGVAEIVFESAPNDEAVKMAVEKSGYRLDSKNELDQNNNSDEPNKRNNILQNIIIFTIVGLSLFLLAKVEISKFYPSLGDEMTVLIAIGLGVVASLSTCLALTGGIVMGFSAKLNEHFNNPTLIERAKPQIMFHLGRLGGFFILGGLLGSLGSAINYSLTFMSVLVIAVALVMFYLGLNIMGLVPNITSLGFHLPKRLGLLIKQHEKKDHPLVPFSIGILTFFLPCGFTQSMQLAAVATGSFLYGGLTMFFFALGTIPVLFSVGLGSSFAGEQDYKFTKKFIGALIIFFALYTLNNGLVMAGSPITFNLVKTKADTEQIIDKNSEEQTVRLDIDYTFKQNEIKIKKGLPVKFEINAINVTGCSNEVIIPRLGLSSGKLKNGDLAIIEFTPTETGTLPFSCWMGMITGKFIVTD